MAELVELFKVFANTGGLPALVILLLFVLMWFILKGNSKDIGEIKLALGIGKAEDKVEQAKGETELLRAKHEILKNIDDALAISERRYSALSHEIVMVKQEVVRLGYALGLVEYPDRRAGRKKVEVERRGRQERTPE